MNCRKMLLLFLLLAGICLAVEEELPKRTLLDRFEGALSSTFGEEMELPKISLFETHSNVYLSKGRRSINGWIREDSLYGEWYGFHAGIWSYADLEGKSHRHGEAIEWDYYGGYGHRFGGDWPIVKSVKLTFRYNYYDEPSHPKNDCEDLRFFINTDSWIKTELQCRYTTKTDRSMFRFRLSKSFELSPKLVLNNSADVWLGSAKFNGVACPGGWKAARRYKRAGNPLGDCYKDGVHSFIYTLGLDYKINKHCSIGPVATVAWALDHDVREGWKAREHCNAFNSNVGFILKLRF